MLKILLGILIAVGALSLVISTLIGAKIALFNVKITQEMLDKCH